MAGLSAYAEQRALHHFLRGISFTPPVNIYTRLFVTPPADDGSGGVEVTGTGYAGQLTSFGAHAARQIKNANTIQFTNSGSPAWPQASHFGLYDAQSGGNLLFQGTLGQRPVVLGGGAYVIDPGNLVVTYQGGTVWLAQRVLELVFKAQAHATISPYGCLFPTAPSLDGIGGTELSATGYVRKLLPMAAYQAASKRTYVGSDVEFTPSAPVAWGAQAALVLNDAEEIATGNRLIVLPFTAIPTIEIARAFSINAADTYVQLD